MISKHTLFQFRWQTCYWSLGKAALSNISACKTAWQIWHVLCFWLEADYFSFLKYFLEFQTKIAISSSVFHHDHKPVAYVTKSRCHKAALSLAIVLWGRDDTIKTTFLNYIVEFHMKIYLKRVFLPFMHWNRIS